MFLKRQVILHIYMYTLHIYMAKCIQCIYMTMYVC